MKVTIAQAELLRGLKTVARAVSGQPTLPVLGNIMLRAEGKKLQFSATNLEISITTNAEATVQNEGAITVPSKIMTAYVSLLKKGGDVELETVDGTALQVKCGRSKTKMKGIAAEEFPNISTLTGGTTVTLDSKTWREAVGLVAFAAQENAARPILSGVYVHLNGQELRLAATDSYRLSEKVVLLDEKYEDTAKVVPVRSILEADRLAGGSDTVSLTVGENQVLLKSGDTELTSRLIDGVFPNYQQIIPRQHTTTVTIDRSELELAVRRVSIFAKENNQHMKLHLQADSTMKVCTDMTEIGEDQTTIAVEMTGEANMIALNADYLLDILTALSGEEQIVLEMQDKIKPAVLKRVSGDDFVHLVMPLKV